MRAIALILMALTLVPAAARAEKVKAKVTRADCQNVVSHQPDADVAYRPGVDVHGNAVVPADLNGGSQFKAPKEIHIPITIDIGKRFGVSSTSGLYDAEAEMGVVTWRDGKITYNGQPLNNQDEAALAAACRRILNK